MRISVSLQVIVITFFFPITVQCRSELITVTAGGCWIHHDTDRQRTPPASQSVCLSPFLLCRLSICGNEKRFKTQFHKLRHSAPPRHLQQPPLWLRQICTSKWSARDDGPTWADIKCSSSFPPVYCHWENEAFCLEDLFFETVPCPWRQSDRFVTAVAKIDDTETPQFHSPETAVVCLCARTCKHHDMLKVGANFIPAAQVEQEGQRVDVCCPAQKHGQLHDAQRSRIQHSFEVTQQTRPVRTLPSSHESHLCLLSTNTRFLYKCDIISGGK